jgi:hypothetical protein
MPDWKTNQLAMNWAPYANEGEATFCLSRFIDKALSPDIGIIWCAADACALIRKARPDSAGFSYTVVMGWQPVVPPPPPPPKPTFWQKVEKVFWDEMAREGERDIEQGQAELAMGQAIVDFFGSKDGEHITSLAFDVLGVVCFITLFIPGVGEAELGVIAAIRAGQIALTAGRVTAGLAVAGTMLAARVDGTYVLLRYRDGEEAAKQWEDSPEASRESIAAALLALPDFAVGGVMLARDLATLPGRIGTAEQEAARAKNQIGGANQYIQKMENKHGGAVPAGSRDAKKIADNAARAKRLAELAKEANLKSQQLSNKLYVAMLANAPSTFVGTPIGEAYFNRDDPHFWHDHLSWVGALLTPTHATGTSPPAGNFSAKVGVSGQSPTGN